jgi:hypothetical protein
VPAEQQHPRTGSETHSQTLHKLCTISNPQGLGHLPVQELSCRVERYLQHEKHTMIQKIASTDTSHTGQYFFYLASRKEWFGPWSFDRNGSQFLGLGYTHRSSALDGKPVLTPKPDDDTVDSDGLTNAEATAALSIQRQAMSKDTYSQGNGWCGYTILEAARLAIKWAKARSTLPYTAVTELEGSVKLLRQRNDELAKQSDQHYQRAREAQAARDKAIAERDRMIDAHQLSQTALMRVEAQRDVAHRALDAFKESLANLQKEYASALEFKEKLLQERDQYYTKARNVQQTLDKVIVAKNKLQEALERPAQLIITGPKRAGKTQALIKEMQTEIDSLTIERNGLQNRLGMITAAMTAPLE